MLQQTRVEAVIPYFERFLAELPDVEALAAVSEERLMKLWEGLGYYSRARNLQKAAKLIVHERNGLFPASPEELLRLPGIGTYTAGAISSIAYNHPEPAVDGNVIRVIARLTDDDRDAASPLLKTEYAARLRPLYPRDRCGDFTQALMELGATVCLPNGKPRCERCPLAALCAGRKSDRADSLPSKKAKKARRIEKRTVLLLCHGDRIAICRRPSNGLLAQMWEFPNFDGFLSQAELKKRLTESGLEPESIRTLPESKHIFTHIEWHMRNRRVECRHPAASYTWVTRDELETTYSMPNAFKGIDYRSE